MARPAKQQDSTHSIASWGEQQCADHNASLQTLQLHTRYSHKRTLQAATARRSPSNRPSVALASTLYISLLMPPDLDTKPTEPGRCSLQAMMFSRVPAVSPILKAPACSQPT